MQYHDVVEAGAGNLWSACFIAWPDASAAISSQVIFADLFIIHLGHNPLRHQRKLSVVREERGLPKAAARLASGKENVNVLQVQR